MNNYYKDVKNYFNSKADEYDDVDNQLYWVLSDEYFKKVLLAEIPKLFKDRNEIKLLDAGAGTGRWSYFFYDLFKEVYKTSGTLIDISDRMLKVARNKFEQKNIAKDFDFFEGNIENMSEIKDGIYDLSISFYNVISFVENPDKALMEINKKLKSDGVHISIVANKYHANYFAILTNRLTELDRIKNESKVAFNDIMPAIHCFTPNELELLYKKAGFEEVIVIGGPNFIYPGMEETFVHGSTKKIQNILNSKKDYRKILNTEFESYKNKDISGRGNVLMAIAKK